jgi:formate hydrogenlyase subunit 3/multisubunit Na+/H+ antiporter MnhD subunit
MPLSVAPLTGGFMITSIVGFLISAVYVYPNSKTWGFTFAIFFTLMFVASMISMTYAPTDFQIGKKKKT